MAMGWRNNAAGTSEPPAMNTTLAIYEALIQANVPAHAARRAAEALESDMLTHLATKQDLTHLEQRVNARFDSLETLLVQRIDAGDERLSQRIDSLDHRLSQRISDLDQHLNQRIDALDQHLSQRIDGLDQSLNQRVGALDHNVNQRIDAFDQSVAARLAANLAQYDLKLQNLESRLVIKLGALMTVLLGAASALPSLLR